MLNKRCPTIRVCLISRLGYNVIMLEKYRQILMAQGEVYLRLKARPGAPQTEFKAIMDDETIKVDIAAPAEAGRANEALISWLAQELDVNRNSVRVISGAGERLKLVKIIKL